MGGYWGKKYSDYSSAEAMVLNIKEGKVPNRATAYRELVTIINEWSGTKVAKDAQYLIDTKYSDLHVF